MRAWLRIIAVMPALASADELAHPDDLVLGELGALQDAQELQVGISPSQTRDGWEQGFDIEYGVTRRLQLAVGGTWHEDGERALSLAVLVAPIRAAHVALAFGAEASTDGEVEPMMSVIAGAGGLGANLALASSLEGEPRVAAAVFARWGRWKPLAEGAAGEEYAWRIGCAVQLGAFEVLAAGGSGSATGPGVDVIASWAIELAGDDDHDDQRAAMR